MLCVSVILVHNHPSGDPQPSKEDIELTKRLAKAGEIMSIDVLDHIIVGSKNYLSLKSRESVLEFESDMLEKPIQEWHETAKLL